MGAKDSMSTDFLSPTQFAAKLTFIERVLRNERTDQAQKITIISDLIECFPPLMEDNMGHEVLCLAAKLNLSDVGKFMLQLCSEEQSRFFVCDKKSEDHDWSNPASIWIGMWNLMNDEEQSLVRTDGWEAYSPPLHQDQLATKRAKLMQCAFEKEHKRMKEEGISKKAKNKKVDLKLGFKKKNAGSEASSPPPKKKKKVAAGAETKSDEADSDTTFTWNLRSGSKRKNAGGPLTPAVEDE